MFGKKSEIMLENENEEMILLLDIGTSKTKTVSFSPIEEKDREKFCQTVFDRTVVFPTVIARHKGSDEYLVGDAALEYESVYQTYWPKAEGSIKDMESFKDFLLAIVDINKPVKEVVMNEVVDQPLVFKQSVERILKKEGVQKVTWILEPVAVLNRLGKGALAKYSGAGLVVDVGSGTSDIVACGLNEKGSPEQIPHTHLTTPLGGDDMTFSTIRILKDTLNCEFGVINKSAPNWSYCVKLKEDLLNGQEVKLECSNNNGKTYRLPEQMAQKIINVLFEPDARAKGGRQILPIDEVIKMSVSASPARVHDTLYSNIVLTGGPIQNDRIFNHIKDTLQKKFPNHKIRAQRPERPQTAVIEGMYVLKMAEHVKEAQK